MKTPNGISYQTRVSVYLDGRLVGEIKETIKLENGQQAGRPGFRYYPLGSRDGGPWFETVEAVKRSLEAS